jgi:hypothetical protein
MKSPKTITAAMPGGGMVTFVPAGAVAPAQVRAGQCLSPTALRVACVLHEVTSCR